MSNFTRIFDQPKTTWIVIVSGLPRSGTSLMMKMLSAGGLPALTDGERSADQDNPQGYYEYERVKRLPDGDYAWLEQANGKAVKVISALLQHLPASYHYQVIFMRRALVEILASQRTMLSHRGNSNSDEDAELERIFSAHLASTEAWLATHPNFKTLFVDYNLLLTKPDQQIAALENFLPKQLDIARMQAVIDPSLYRQRANSAKVK